MCRVEFYKDPYCGHRWARVTRPCYPGYGFTTCPSFFNGSSKSAPRCFVAVQEPCPKCDLRGTYDRNQIRVVRRVRNGFRLGTGPSRRDPGVDIGDEGVGGLSVYRYASSSFRYNFDGDKS
ncbi:hypothetical protein B0T17DRAFT_620348 [Bombardia bombarda]|uniref:Uncharacterized protein n=1 Tax=Bombardia bombarda TaxID=252184 RepID=A0AA39U5Q7_9PEZI|nr:hypothetical protein B0T17DRAFT_620348 [Bombardia bombarda]